MSWKAVPMEPSEREAVAGLVTTVFGRGPRPSDAVQRELDLLLEPDRMIPRRRWVGATPTSLIDDIGSAAPPGNARSKV